MDYIIFHTVISDEPTSFSPTDHIDPEYGLALRQAQKTGVKIVVCTCLTSPESMQLGKETPYTF